MKGKAQEMYSLGSYFWILIYILRLKTEKLESEKKEMIVDINVA